MQPGQYEIVGPNNEDSGIEILNEVLPINSRRYEVTCLTCSANLKFSPCHVRCTPGFFWTTFDVKCPICSFNISVQDFLEVWVKLVLLKKNVANCK